MWLYNCLQINAIIVIFNDLKLIGHPIMVVLASMP
jgi:hypothetical protein